MKNRILTFIIGILVGAIIATAGFFVYNKSMNKNKMMNPTGNKGQMQRPNGEMGDPSEKPQGNFKGKIQNTNV